MSVQDSENASTATPESPDVPASSGQRLCASYMGCRHCEEGSLVYDRDAGASRCRSCGKLDR